MIDEQAEYVFKVSDGIPAGVDGLEKRDPWIWAEPVHGNLSILKKNNQHMGFVLLEDTSQEEAERIANYLNEHIKAVTIW